MKMSSYVVYGLEDPRDRLFHYIGITDDIYTRFTQHVTGSGGNIQKNGWIWECRQANIMIIMRELQQVETLEEARERERLWIAYYLQLGHPLHNLTIAKDIEKQKVALEQRLAELEGRIARLEAEAVKVKSLELMPLENPPSSYEETDLQDIATAWKKGYQSIDKISAALGLSPWQARQRISQAKVKGLI